MKQLIILLVYISFLSPIFAETLSKQMEKAIMKGDIETVQKMLDEGFDINTRGSAKGTPLIYAANYAKYEIAELLINKGAKVNVKNDIYWTALHYVCASGYKELDKVKFSKLLIEHGADVNAKGGVSATSNMKLKQTPLHYAARQKGGLELVKLLVKNGAKINAKDYEKVTPIYNAIYYGRKEIVKYLLEKRAKINIKENYKGLTPLHKAISGGKIEIIKYLIAYGADLTIKNKKGHNVYEHARSFKWRNQDKSLLILQKASTPEVQSLIKAGKKEEVIKILTEAAEEAGK